MRTSSMPGSVWEEWFNWKLDDGDALRRFVIRSKWRGVEEERNRESESSGSSMGAVSELEMLQARAQLMQESLGKSQSATESMISILGFFDHRLSTLESAMCPTQVLLLANSHLSHDHWASVSRELFLQNHSDSYASCATISWTSILMRQRRTCLRNCTCSSFYWTFKSGCSRLTLSKLEPN